MHAEVVEHDFLCAFARDMRPSGIRYTAGRPTSFFLSGTVIRPSRRKGASSYVRERAMMIGSEGKVPEPRSSHLDAKTTHIGIPALCGVALESVTRAGLVHP